MIKEIESIKEGFEFNVISLDSNSPSLPKGYFFVVDSDNNILDCSNLYAFDHEN